MGNFHCIPSNCGTVTYREYLPPVVRWRYPGEEWQEIQGDDYTVEQKYPDNTKFVVDFSVDYYGYGNYINSFSNRRIPYLFPGKIIDIYGYEYDGNYYTHVVIKWIENNTGLEKIYRYFVNTSPNSKYIVTDWIATPDRPPTNCEFKIFNQEELVYIETRNTCPEVEKLPCRLSDVTKQIKIEKIPYLERIEVRSEGIDYISLLPPILQGYDIPDECLNIYLTYTLAPPIISEYKPIPGVTNPYQFIQQICSVPGCPPPKYEVICDCNDCESCPENTCVVECEGNICCYDKVTGKSIKSIPIDNYCRDEL